MDPRQVEYFLAVAECGSISAAARQLGVSQPTLSEAVARMESDLAVPLFRRQPRGVVLTGAGRDLVGPAAQVLRAHAELKEALRPAQHLERGRLSVVCPRTLAQDPVAELVGRFRQRYPGVVVSLLRPHGGESAVDVVASGRAEVGIGVGNPSGTDLTSELLTRQRVVALLHPDLDVGPSPDLADLVARGLVVTPQGGVTRRLLSECLGQRVVDEAVVVETSSTGAMVPLVRAGLGIAFVSEAMGRDAEAVGLLVRAPRPALRRDVWLTFGATLSPAAREFVAMARRMREARELEPAT
ncbi:LysR family transcriptional regulator [Aeromicrobium sp.]|uniref:LysR family transcriptional regulator n=1 Tax=Aeromicrobium sp. TaxID=1871063 RepID=UPI0028AEFD49|nr:LysR family transcriptional regulator [Aeromicrobium sp.]